MSNRDIGKIGLHNSLLEAPAEQRTTRFRKPREIRNRYPEYKFIRQSGLNSRKVHVLQNVSLHNFVEQISTISYLFVGNMTEIATGYIEFSNYYIQNKFPVKTFLLSSYLRVYDII